MSQLIGSHDLQLVLKTAAPWFLEGRDFACHRVVPGTEVWSLLDWIGSDVCILRAMDWSEHQLCISLESGVQLKSALK